MQRITDFKLAHRMLTNDLDSILASGKSRANSKTAVSNCLYLFMAIYFSLWVPNYFRLACPQRGGRLVPVLLTDSELIERHDRGEISLVAWRCPGVQNVAQLPL